MSQSTSSSTAAATRNGTSERPGALTRHEIVYSSTQPGPAEWRFDRGSAVRPRPRLRVSAVEAAVTAAVAGRGVTRPLSYQVADELSAGRLLRILAAYDSGPIPVQLVISSARLTPPRLRAFLDYAATERSRLAVIRPG